MLDQRLDSSQRLRQREDSTGRQCSLHGVFASSVEPAELPLLLPPDKIVHNSAFEKELQKRQAAVDRFLKENHARLLPVFRAKIAPYLVAADAAFYSGKNEAAAKVKGVKRVCVPNRSTKSPERKREQKKRWFRNGQKWRTGCEGRISVVKRRHGLGRSRYKGDAGMQRWVGLGVIADNLVNISRVMAKQPGR